MTTRTGILLLNIGTPAAPTKDALRSYLKEFLGDRYVVDYPRWLWQPILHGIILRTRPKRSAQLYARIWQDAGSPLLTTSQAIAASVAAARPEWQTVIGMRYGQPDILSGLTALQQAGVTDLVVFPLFPQYSSSTSQTAIERTLEWVVDRQWFEQVTVIEEYHDHPAYIAALAESIRAAGAAATEGTKLLFSFHGVPRRYVTQKGEPYFDQCQTTAAQVAEKLGLSPEQYRVAFQSRFGPETWLQPYTDRLLEELGAEGCPALAVICPGFAADCLETLEEIAIEGREIYEVAGGQGYTYIPALNDSQAHIQALVSVIEDALK